MDQNAFLNLQMDSNNLSDINVGTCFCSRSNSWSEFLFNILELPVSVVGVIANFISIFILNYQYSNSSKLVRLLFQSLCVGNILLIVSGCVTDMTPVVICNLDFPGFENYLVERLFFIIQVLPEISHTFLLYLIILVTVTRLSAIRNSRSRQENIPFFKNSLSIVILDTILLLLTILLNIPIILVQNLKSLPFDRNESEFWSAGSPKLYVIEMDSSSESQFYHYYKIFRLIVHHLLPIFIILVINLSIFFFIKQNLAPRRTNASNYSDPRSNEKHVLKFLAIYLALFLISEIPETFLHLSEFVFELYPNFLIDLIQFIRSNYTITRMLLEFNASLNVIVFCFSGRKFRNALKQKFCRGRNRRTNNFQLTEFPLREKKNQNESKIEHQLES